MASSTSSENASNRSAARIPTGEWLGVVANDALFILTTAVYFFRLSKIPNGYYQDTGGVLLNAECLAKVGTDEYGTRYPLLVIRSFGEGKAPGYVYLVAALERFMTMTPYRMRVISAFLGITAVALVVACAYTTRAVRRPTNVWLYGLAFCLFALSPWVLALHRFPTESTLVNLIVVGNVASAHGMVTTGKVRYAIANGLCAGIGGYAYHSLKLMVVVHPILVIGCLWQARGIRRKKAVFAGLASVLVAALVAGPMLKDMLAGGDSMLRFRGLASADDTWLAKATRYFSNLDVNFLFLSGDANLRHNDGFMGELSLGLLPFVVRGAVIARRAARSGEAFWTYVLAMAVFGFAPAALVPGPPHALRANAATAPLFFLSFLAIAEMDGLVRSLGRFARAHPFEATAGAMFAVASVWALVAQLSWYFGPKYADASAKSWRATADVDKELSEGNRTLAPDNHGEGSVFLRAANVASGDLRYCNAKR